MREAIQIIKQNTGLGKVFDPYQDPDMLPWNKIGTELLRGRRIMEAMTVFQAQLQSYFDAQEATGARVHKGTPYHFLGEVHLRMGNLGYAREQFLLAFVEDVLTEVQTSQGGKGVPSISSAYDTPAGIVLDLTFRMRKAELEDLVPSLLVLRDSGRVRADQRRRLARTPRSPRHARARRPPGRGVRSGSHSGGGLDPAAQAAETAGRSSGGC